MIFRPRWLYTRGRKEEARQILAKLHSSTGDINSPLIELEIEEIEEKIEIDGADSPWQRLYSVDFVLTFTQNAHGTLNPCS